MDRSCLCGCICAGQLSAKICRTRRDRLSGSRIDSVTGVSVADGAVFYESDKSASEAVDGRFVDLSSSDVDMPRC